MRGKQRPRPAAGARHTLRVPGTDPADGGL